MKLLIIINLFFSTLALAQCDIVDNDFGDNGTLITTFGSFDQFMSKSILRGDQLICLGYYERNNDIPTIALSFINDDGTFNTDIGNNGKLLVQNGDDVRPGAILVLPNGKYLIAGYMDLFFNEQLIYLMLNEDGTIDTDFAQNGWLYPPETSNFIRTTDLLVTNIVEDQSIISIGILEDNDKRHLTITTFDQYGEIILNHRKINIIAVSDISIIESIQHNQNIYLSGYGKIGSKQQGFVTRFKEGGLNTDSNFGFAHKYIMPSIDTYTSRIIKIKSIENVGILCLGSYYKSNSQKIFLAMLDEFGNPIPEYFENGTKTFDLSSNSQITDIIKKGENFLLSSRSFSSFKSAVYKINLEGEFDTNFGINGKLSLNSDESELANNIHENSNGELLITGNSSLRYAVWKIIPCTNVSTNEISFNRPLIIQPNPSQHSIKITVPQNVTMKLIISNSTGQIIKTIYQESNNSIQIDISDLESGKYYISGNNSIDVWSTTFIKI